MEQWKAIPGFEGIYEASTCGRIRSAEGKTTHSEKWGVVHWKQRIIKQHYAKRKNGKPVDARVTLWRDKRPHYFLVSRLIAMTWCDGYADGLTVNHIDGNPRNNSATNLEWVTISENIRKGFEDGLFPQKKVVLLAPDGNALRFRSMAQASRFLGKNNGYISDRIKAKHKHTACGYTIIVSA